MLALPYLSPPIHSILQNGNQVLTQYGYADGKLGHCFLFMIIIAIVTHLLAFLNLWRNSASYMKVAEAPAATSVRVSI